MPYNGSGTYSLPSGNPVVTGTTISSTTHNNTMSDIASALSNALTKDGQSTPSANIKMGGFKHTGLVAGSAATDSANLGQVQGNAYCWLGTGGGTADVITASASPTLTAYAAGQVFRFLSSGANTTNVTLNIDGVGAKAVTKNGTAALAAGDIPSGAVCEVVYDGTQFQLRGALNTGAIVTIASATTTDIGAATNAVIISGSTAITSLGTVGAGAVRNVTFSGALTLTHNATSLILPGSANITTAAGDTASFVSLGSGNWRCIAYQRADGKAVLSLTSGTAQNTTSGTAIDFTGIPSWVKRITVSLSGVSTTGGNPLLVQLGTSGGVLSSGYASVAGRFDGTGTAASAAISNGLPIYAPVGSNDTIRALMTIVKHSGNTWVAGVTGGVNGTGVVVGGGGDVSLGGTLDRLRLTTTTGTDAFDAGSVNIHYE